VNWKAFESDAPALAAMGRHFFYLVGVGMGFLATVRADGGPRVHPICPILTDDALFALIMPGPKLHDLRRDGRFALHGLTSPPPNADDASTSPVVRQRCTTRSLWEKIAEQLLAEREMSTRWPGFESQVLFVFDVRRCLLTLTGAREGFPAGHTRWPERPR
jgi:hypothetical protein